MMQRHGVMAAVLKIQHRYSKIPDINPSIQKAVADGIGRLLDCNFTRNNLIDPSHADGSHYILATVIIIVVILIVLFD